MKSYTVLKGCYCVGFGDLPQGETVEVPEDIGEELVARGVLAAVGDGGAVEHDVTVTDTIGLDDEGG